MAVRRRSKSRGRGLSLRPIGCAPALSVMYSAAAAAVAACVATQAATASIILIPFTVNEQRLR